MMKQGDKTMYGAETKDYTCSSCNITTTLEIRPESVKAYENGAFIQEAFPYLTDDQRELMLSGICGVCFDDMFPDE